jgi:hypothetical protein
MRVRRHGPPVRALRGNVAAKRFTLFVLGHCGICKATGRTKYRNRQNYLDHVPHLSIAERLAGAPKPDECAALSPTNTLIH